MNGALTPQPMAFRFDTECKEKLEKIASFYGTKNKTKALKKLIDEAYQTHIINLQIENKKEEN